MGIKKEFIFRRGDFLTMDDLDPLISSMEPIDINGSAVASRDIKVTVEFISEFSEIKKENE